MHLLLLESNVAYLGFDKHQIDKQDDEVVLDILVRKALTTRTLGQAYVSTTSRVRRRGLRFRELCCIVGGPLGTGDVGADFLVGRIGDMRSGGFVISAMEDVVEL